MKKLLLLFLFLPAIGLAQPSFGSGGTGVSTKVLTDTLNSNIPRNSTSIDTTNRLLPGWKGQTVTTPGAITMTDGTLTASIGNVTSVAGMVQGYQGVFDSTLIKCGTDMSKQSTASIGAYGSQTNISVSIAPKGTGAFYLGPKADGTVAGGNARGANAVDLQTAKGSAATVASGVGSFLGSGHYNSATGEDAVVVGGYTNTASGQGSIVPAGYFNQATGLASLAQGWYASATNIGSVGLGNYGRASHANEFAVGSSPRYSPNTACRNFQYSVMQVSDTTGSAVGDTLTIGAYEWTDPLQSATNKVRFMNIDSGDVWVYSVLVSARSDVGDVAGWRIDGVIQRVGATTSMVGSPTITTLAATAGASTWTVTAVADDTNDALQILNQGSAAKNVRWHAVVQISMLGW